MYCPKCGNEIKEGDLFCSKCGAKMTEHASKSADSRVLFNKVQTPNKPDSVNINTESGKKHKSLLAGCVVLLIVVVLLARIWNPGLPTLNAAAVMEAYLEKFSISK